MAPAAPHPPSADDASPHRRDEPPHAPLPDLLPEDGPERHPAIRWMLIAGAVACVAIGIIGWLLPVVPGFPFYILAAVLAGTSSPRAARFVNRQERRLPRRLRLLLRTKRRRAPRDGDRATRGE